MKQGTHRSLRMANVLGMIPGERTNEYVVVGAHFDHLGIDETLAGDKIYNGADDNASGVSAVMQIARAFQTSGKKPLRNVIIAFWDGEEKGLLGSKYFMQHCDFVKDIKGYLNFDMIGRNNRPEQPEHVVYFYTEAHPALGQWLKDDIARYGLKLQPDYRPWDRPVGGSDNASFAVHDIPIIWYHTDGHPDYHQPSDHADKLNWEKVVEITKASFLNARTWLTRNRIKPSSYTEQFHVRFGVVMPPMPNCSTSTLATLGERKAGSVGPRWICFTPRLKRASRTMTAFCSYQAMLYMMGSSLMSFNWKTSFSFRAMTASE